MGLLTFTDGKLYYQQYDLSGRLNRIACDAGAAMLDASVFGVDTEVNQAGLLKGAVELGGFWDADGTATSDLPDDALWDAIGLNDRVVSAWPTAPAEGSVGFALLANLAEYRLGGQVGELLPITAMFASGGSTLRTRPIRPTCLGTGAKGSTGSGAARQLGAVSASQRLYGFLHVLRASGTNPTLDVIVESDNAEGFGSGTTRITFAQKTARGAEWAAPVAGAITDDWWRAAWTIGGTDNPSFTVLIGVAIH